MTRHDAPTDPPAPADDRPPLRVLVLGATGFIGRHAALALQAQGCALVLAGRHPERDDPRLPAALAPWPRRRARFEDLGEAEAWATLLAGVDAVLNCVGILRPVGRARYDAVHHAAPGALARACAARGLRLVHVSALGLGRDARSGFLRSKWAGEQAIRAAGGDWHLVRPSLLDGPGGFGARWIRRVAQWPLALLPADAVGRMAPLDVRDLGLALARLVREGHARREHELGGAEARTMREHLACMRAPACGPAPPALRLPGLLARLGAHACDALHLTPYSFGHWELLLRDNLPAHDALPELLGRAPRRVAAAAGEARDPHAPSPAATRARGIA
jgi:NADH dehydrogenase